MGTETQQHPILSRAIGGTAFALGVLLILAGLVYFAAVAGASDGFTYDQIDFAAGTVTEIFEWDDFLIVLGVSSAFGLVGLLLCALGARILTAVAAEPA